MIDDDGAVAMPMPKTERDTWNIFTSLGNTDFAYIEKVAAMPGQGVVSMFSFGRNYGFLRACLIASGIPFEDVTPLKWQRPLGLVKTRSKGAPKESSTDKKNRHKARAQQLWPDLKITHAIADALLIAEWGRRMRA